MYKITYNTETTELKNRKELLDYLNNKNSSAYELARWATIIKATKVKLSYSSNLFKLVIEET